MAKDARDGEGEHHVHLQALDPGFHQLVDASESIEHVATVGGKGTAFQTSTGIYEHLTEGPVWNPQGFLLFSDIFGDKIYEWSPTGGLAVFREPSGYSNGLTFDHQGRLVICNQELRRLERLEADGKITVLADEWEGRKLNCPNDVVIRQDGNIYFSDPYWGFPTGSVQELSFKAVFRVDPSGQLFVEATDFGVPNGVALSPDQNTLYVADTPRKKLHAFDVGDHGSLTGQRLFAELESDEKGPVDGMKVDEQGNIWTTGPGGMWVFGSEGKHLGIIRPPDLPRNCAWGDEDYRSLYMATPKSVYRLRTRVRGLVTYPTDSEAKNNYPSFC